MNGGQVNEFSGKPVYTQEEMDMYCAWADYRSEYGVSGIGAYNEFTAGWKAARDSITTLNFYGKSADWHAGFEAYLGTLDIGGVMR